jgi:hypothetical protein
MLAQWRKRGYALESNAVHTRTLRGQLASTFANSAVPLKDWGGDSSLEFPSAAYPALNDLATDPHLLRVAQKLLGTEDVRLMQCVAWPKFGDDSSFDSASNRDQRVHMDYGNNGFLHPPAWESPQVAAAIVYLSDCDETGGGTCVVPRRGDYDPVYRWPYVHMPGIGSRRFHNDRSHAEAYMREKDPHGWMLRQLLYERELQLSPEAGSVLWYRHDVWHRGTPVKKGAVRYVVNMAWRRADAPGICCWNAGFSRRLYEPFMRRLVASLDGNQLRSLGFPPRDHSYWNAQTREAVRLRYGADLVSRL